VQTIPIAIPLNS